MPSTSKRSHRSRAQWQALIARGEHSELGVTEFCRRESLNAASFYVWRNRLRAIAEQVSTPEPAAVDSGFIDLGTLDRAKESAGPRGNRAGPGRRVGPAPEAWLMFFPEGLVRVFVRRRPVDMRKSFTGLTAIAHR